MSSNKGTRIKSYTRINSWLSSKYPAACGGDLYSRALVRPDVRLEYEGLEEEFEVLDEILQARAKRDSPRLDR